MADRSLGARVVVIIAMAALATACGDSSGERNPDAAASGASADSSNAGSGNATEIGSPTTTVTSTTTSSPASTTAVVPPTIGEPPPTNAETLPPASVGLPEEPPINEAGDPITLDETALLACAHAQFAWVSLQADDVAAADLEIAGAATRAEASAVPAVVALADDLRDASTSGDRLVPVQGLLDTCVANGFEY